MNEPKLHKDSKPTSILVVMLGAAIMCALCASVLLPWIYTAWMGG